MRIQSRFCAGLLRDGTSLQLGQLAQHIDRACLRIFDLCDDALEEIAMVVRLQSKLCQVTVLGCMALCEKTGKRTPQRCLLQIRLVDWCWTVSILSTFHGLRCHLASPYRLAIGCKRSFKVLLHVSTWLFKVHF